MRRPISLLTLLSSLLSPTLASPFSQPNPQAVTALLSPSGPSPAACSTTHLSTFGIAAFRLPPSQEQDSTPADRQRIAPRKRQQESDGCSTVTVTAGSSPTQAAGKGQPLMPVSQIGDGQVQAPPSPGVLVDPAAATTTLPPSAEQQQQGGLPFADPTSASTFTTTITPTATSTPSTNSTTISPKLSACLTPSTLLLSLSSSLLTDSLNRTGYIASNYQFQFDAPPQSDSLFTAGWSVCGNGSLSLGASARFWQCRSGGFSNLYDRWWAEQCEEVRLVIVETDGMVGCEGIWE